MLQSSEVGEVCDPHFENSEGDNFRHPRIWRTWDTQQWRTNYPPPPDFDGHEEDDWEEEDYCRALSDEELAALVAAGIAEPAEARSEVTIEQDEAERDMFFAQLAPREGGDRPD